MQASLITRLTNGQDLVGLVGFLVIGLFQLWMLADALRRREWLWALFIFIGAGLSALFYYFIVYREAPAATRGFELPGAYDRRRIRELEAQIHHLDKAHHYSQLGDIYFHHGRLEKAEACYRAALERDPADIDTGRTWANASCAKKGPPRPAPCWKAWWPKTPNTTTATRSWRWLKP